MTKGLFISSTSTGMGKTVVSALICKKLVAAGKRVAYYKPIQTGADSANPHAASFPDAGFVSKIIGREKNFSSHCTYSFPEAASPHFAAKQEESKIRLKKIRDDYSRLADEHDYIITEGAGGLYVPLNSRGLVVADIPRILSLNVLLVSFAGLGAINQIGLSAFFLAQKNLRLSSILMLMENKKPSAIESDNLRMINYLTRVPNCYLYPKVRKVDTEKGKSGEISQRVADFPKISEMEKWF